MVGVEDSMPGQGAKQLSTHSPANALLTYLIYVSQLSAQAQRGGYAAYCVLSETSREKMYFNFNDLI